MKSLNQARQLLPCPSTTRAAWLKSRRAERGRKRLIFFFALVCPTFVFEILLFLKKMTVSFRRIASLAVPEIPMLAFAMIMLLLSSAMLLVVPVLFGLIIGSIRSGDHATLMKAV